jgi:hypothetical protein
MIYILRIVYAHRDMNKILKNIVKWHRINNRKW